MLHRLPKPSVCEPLLLFVLAVVLRGALLFVMDNNGSDGVIRYQISALWAENPLSLPSPVWLPLHFWLLGSLQWMWPGELAARIVTLLFGAATIFPFWGIVRNAFDRETALYSTLTFSLLGLHLSYSVSTSAEIPTLFFLLSGVYCWAQYRASAGWRWLLVGGAAFSAACLCRFEPWLLVATATPLLLLPRDEHWEWPAPGRWLGATGFGLVASAGAIGWMLYSTLKWGDPFAAPHRTFIQNATDTLKVQHGFFYRLAVVPGSLVITLSPFIALAASLGAIRALRRPTSVPAALTILALVGGGAQFYAAVTRDVTQARYTLMYSWLLIPLGFEGLRVLKMDVCRSFAWLFVCFLVWQGGILLGAYVAPPLIADKLAAVSATLPLSVEHRELVGWLNENVRPGDALILDNFNYDHVYIVRHAGLAPKDVFVVPRRERNVVERGITRFIRERKPKFLVYCDQGLLGVTWRLSNDSTTAPSTPPLQLRRVWHGRSYSVYQIEG